MTKYAEVFVVRVVINRFENHATDLNFKPLVVFKAVDRNAFEAGR